MCTWTWIGKGYKVTGPNGNSITLPAAGWRECDGDVIDVGHVGGYWSSTPKDSECTWLLLFDEDGAAMYVSTRCYGGSVRLVQN